jgi:hypothetical protein
MTDAIHPQESISKDQHLPLKRIEHYALAILNGMAAGGSGGLADGDIDYAIDVAERLALKLVERGHIPANH